MRTQTQFLDHVSQNHVRSHGFRNHATRCAAFFLIAVCLCASPVPAQSVRNATVRPTAVAGESWLTHLQRSFAETSMGKTGRLGPPATSGDGTAGDETSGNGTPDHGTALLHGSDLYRMNCRGCHGEGGLGAPPEINSVINPVRATSATAVMERMKATGMEMSLADAAKLAQQSKAMLLERLHHGGQDMPAFPHLSEVEVNSLVAYLRQLAGGRGAEGEQLAVREERVRVGEHIAKSTCHICHSAAGPNPTPQQVYDGVIPPLSTLTARTTQSQFIRKVTHGAPIMMESPAELFRGRMPVFYYLSEDEAADIYLYLTRYPPSQGPAIAADNSAGDSSGSGASKMDAPPSAAVVPQAEAARSQTSTSKADARRATPLLLAATLVLLLLGLGFVFTVYEVRRLSAQSKGIVVHNDGETEPATPQLDGELVA